VELLNVKPGDMKVIPGL